MKKIYLLISHTGTFPAKFMSFFTKDRYTHVSIALTEELSEMYSFGRKYLRFPFPGGFIRESKDSGIYKKFENTRSVLIGFCVDDWIYEEIQMRLRNMYHQKENYKYNFLGIFYAYFGKQRRKTNCFYCSEFVQHVFEPYGLGICKNNQAIKPIDFLSSDKGNVLYEGLLRDYAVSKVG